MTDTTIFDGETPPVEGSTPAIPSIPPEVAEFVGEGKKYKSVEDALKSVPNAQKHISTIEEENAALKAELAKRQATEEILEQLKQTGIPKGDSSTSAPAVDLNIIDSRVAALIAQKEAQQTIMQNTQTVISEFSAVYGDKAEEQYINVAKENGMTVEALNKLAATSPNVVIKLAGLKAKTIPAKTGTSSSVNLEALANTQQQGELSAKVPKGATTKDVVNAWKIAGEKVKQKL